MSILEAIETFGVDNAHRSMTASATFCSVNNIKREINFENFKNPSCPHLIKYTLADTIITKR